MTRSAQGHELEHCRELAMPAGSLFEFTSRFVSADRLDALIAVYALIRLLDSIPFTRAEDSVKWMKLRWWSEELAADPLSPSRHPVLRALAMTGARTLVGDALIQKQIGVVAQQVDCPPDHDMAAMFERFANWGEPAVRMELALEDAELPSGQLSRLAAASGLYAYTASFFPGYPAAAQRLPLAVLARFGSTADELGQQPPSAQMAEVLAHIAGEYETWYRSAIGGLRVKHAGNDKIAGTHLQLRWAMECRKMQKIRNDPAGFLAGGQQQGPADAWFAWRLMRRILRHRRR